MMMGQYSNLVEKQRTLLAVEKWRKGVKLMMMVASPNKKLWTTTYNDDAQLFEKFQDNKWTSTSLASRMSMQDCVDQMSREEQDVKYWK
tara:strand:+ start:417 stop:683 length:267 start_codon:yes stop_codon:yes gene_type:complete